jgi:hypothetical protein
MSTQPYTDGDPLAPHSLSPSELKERFHAERAGGAFLAFRDEHGQLRFIQPASGATMTLGRGAEMDLSIPWDNEVSGLHAELQCLGGEWTVVDDGLSTNGTYVNGRRVTGRQRLRDGDCIRVGHTMLAYRAAAATPAQKTQTAGEQLAMQQLTDTQHRVLTALCRPYREGASFATPATNQQIAAEVFLSVDAVKSHLRTLFGKFELGELPQNQKRAKLVDCALRVGIVTSRDLASEP